jgi:hypothetical protein
VVNVADITNNDFYYAPPAVPTLSTLSPLTGGTEDTKKTIAFADLTAAGNEADSDGTVTDFVVKVVSTGTLKIGTSSATATAFAARTNDTINSTKNAYWTPALNANGSLNAFTVVAKDNDASVSVTPVQAVVTVAAVNDAPTLTLISTLAVPVSSAGAASMTISYADVQAAANEADIDGNAISFRIESVNSAGILIKNSSAVTTGSTLLSVGESLVWTPPADATAPITAFSVKAFDGTTASANTIAVKVALPTLTSATYDALTIAKAA